MSENKFIAKLKGAKSAKSVVEVQDPKAKKSFMGIAGTSDSPQGYSLDTASSVVVANGAENWTCGYGTLTQSADYRGDGSDYTGSWNAGGAGLWMNATYTFPASDDPSNSTVAIINPNAKWVLTLFGAGLLSDGANVVKLKLVVQIGAKNIASKDFVLPVHAFQFCEQLAVDFTESTTEQIKVDDGTQLNVQLLCEDENAHAQIFSGMTVLTLLDRKIDARDVASNKTSFDDLEKRVATNAQAIDVIESKIPANASPTNKMATAAEISNLQTQITSNDNDIVNLQTQITSNDTDIANLQSTKANKATDFQTPITSANKGATMAEITALDNDLQAQITSNDADILKNTQDITALKGAGGALNASNFNTATPTQETLTKYAVDQIWPGNTNWAWNAANPAASTFTDASGVARTAAEIFNSTWVNNTYDDHRWQLTNTQNTEPKVFEWADVGRDIVSVATATTAGIVRVGDGSQMVVNASTGDISLDGTKASGIRSTIGALAANQGSSNSGLILGIDADGDVVPTESGSGGRNIGDIFWTTRTDSALNGAVEANGAQYNFADVNQGQNNVQALLVSGALPSVSIADYESAISSKGWCDKIGYDSGSASFRVPKLTPYIVQKENIPVIGNGTSLGLYNGNNPFSLVRQNAIANNAIITKNAAYNTTVGTASGSGNGDFAGVNYSSIGVVTDPEKSGIIANLSSVASIGRIMIQLFNGATDEAVATCTSVLQDVANLNMGDYVIYWDSGDATDHSHAKPGVSTPAAGTWYRLYKSGWVEQGGLVGNINNTCILVTLPIGMTNTSFTAIASGNTSGIAANYNGITCDRRSATQIAICTAGQQGNGCSWRVDGYAA